MEIESNKAEFNSRRWGELVALLSMDVVRPFYDLMGLMPDSPDGLQRILRQEIIAERKSTVMHPGTSPPMPSPQAVMHAVTESLDAKTSQHLVWWDRHIFPWESRDHRGLRQWTTILQYCLDEPELWNRLGFPGSIRPEHFRRSRNIDEYQRRQEVVDAHPLSDWDLHLYALYLYDDNLYSDPNHVPDGPRLYVKPAVRVYQNYQFWDEVLQPLNSDQLELLWEAARQIVDEEELHSARELPHPSALRILR